MNLLQRRRAMMGVREETSDVLYELHNKSCTSYETINTGVKLFSRDQDWSIAYDFTWTLSDVSTQTEFLRINQENSSALLMVIKRGGSGGGNALLVQYNSGEYRADLKVRATSRFRFVLSHAKNSNTINCVVRKGTETPITGSISKPFLVSTKTASLGYGTSTTGLPTGLTINHVVIYNRVLSSDEINTFLGVST
mgnify:CR=1 FL=1